MLTNTMLQHIFEVVASFYKSRLSFKILASLVAQTVKRLPTMRETWVLSLGGEDLLEKEMAAYSTILA